MGGTLKPFTFPDILDILDILGQPLIRLPSPDRDTFTAVSTSGSRMYHRGMHVWPSRRRNFLLGHDVLEMLSMSQLFVSSPTYWSPIRPCLLASPAILFCLLL